MPEARDSKEGREEKPGTQRETYHPRAEVSSPSRLRISDCGLRTEKVQLIGLEIYANMDLTCSKQFVTIFTPFRGVAWQGTVEWVGAMLIAATVVDPIC
jgi:hypothetical protein